MSHILDLVHRIYPRQKAAVELRIWFQNLEDIWFQDEHLVANNNFDQASQTLVARQQSTVADTGHFPPLP